MLCYVLVDGTVLVNLEIIKKGYGMAYLRFPHEMEKEFLEAELKARWAAVGMWASPRATPQQPAQPQIDKTGLDSHAIIVYITETGSKYHRGTCRYLSKSKIPIRKKVQYRRDMGRVKCVSHEIRRNKRSFKGQTPRCYSRRWCKLSSISPK